MYSVGYTLSDILPAYPGYKIDQLDQLLRDNAKLLNRPVLEYGLLGISPCESKYFNVSAGGFRLNGGTDECLWPPDNNNENIFLFGGSTTLGFGVDDNDTIAAAMQKRFNVINRKVVVYNFGSGNYTLRHELLALLRLLDQGIIPKYCVFLDGCNECLYALGNGDLVSTLNNLYQDEKHRRKLNPILAVIDYAIKRSLKIGWPSGANNYKPITIIPEVEKIISDSGITALLEGGGVHVDHGTTLHLTKIVLDRYLDSVSMIKAICARYDIKPIWFWQPVSYYRCSPQQRIMQKLALIYRYSALSGIIYNELDKNAEFQGIFGDDDDSKFVNISGLGEKIDDILYIDPVHYSPNFSQIIGNFIADRFCKVYN